MYHYKLFSPFDQWIKGSLMILRKQDYIYHIFCIWLHLNEHTNFYSVHPVLSDKKEILHFLNLMKMNVTTSLGPLGYGSEVFGRFQFINESPAVGSCLLVVLILASISGAVGNLLILVALFKSKKMNSLECIFIGNLALSDLYVTLVADPMSLVGT